MTIKFNVNDVLPYLRMAASVVNTKNSIPILGNVLIEAKESNVLRITASDGDTTLTVFSTYIEADSLDDFCVDSKDFVVALSNLTSLVVTITTDSIRRELRCDYGNGNFALPIGDINEYPRARPIESATSTSVTIPAQRFITALNNVAFATANDELKPIMNSVHIDFTVEGNMVAVASDARILAKYTDNGITAIDMEKMEVNLSQKVASTLSSILGNSLEDVTMSFNANSAAFKTTSFFLQCRQIEGKYPNYNAVIPKDNKIEAVVDRAELIAVLQRVSVFSDKATQQIKLSFDADTLTISAEDIDFSKVSSERMSCVYANAPMAIAFASSKLLLLLKNITTEKVRITLSDGTHAAVLLPDTQDEDIAYLALIMPMKYE